MRISDWSSDVCSSDLGSKGSGIGGATLEGPALERLPVLIAADPAHQVIEVGFPCGVFHGGIEEQTAEDDLAAGIGLAVKGGGASFQYLQPGLGLLDLATGGFDSLWRWSSHGQSFRCAILIAPDPTERKRGRAHLCKLAFACVREYP